MGAERADRIGSGVMVPADRFEPHEPDVQAVVRLEEALPPDHPGSGADFVKRGARIR